MKKLIQFAHDVAIDGLEKCSSPASRAGHAIERAGKLLAQRMTPKVVAAVMTSNSRNGTKYTVSKVVAYGELYQDSLSGQVLPAKHYTAIIADQKAAQFDVGGAGVAAVSLST